MNALDTALPPEFADLEPYAGWALATETARNHKRIDSAQADIDAFVAALLPRLDAICGYLDTYALDALPPAAQQLFFLLLSVAEASPSSEGYRAPSVPYGYDSRRFQAQENFPLRPRF
jgi:hypothetical protein